MSLDKLKELIGENEEGLKVLNEVATTQTELTKKLNFLELESKRAFEARDTFKTQLKTVKEKLGLEDITDEALEKVLKGKKSDDAEVNNLKAMLEKATKEREEIESGYKSKLSEFVLKSELTKTGLAQKAINGEMYGILESLALKGAKTDENGVIIFTNEDGSTKYVNGKPMTLADRVAELENSEAYAPMFKPNGKGGTGAGRSGGANGSKKRSEMTHGEKAEFITKFGQDEFLKLPK